MEYFTLLKFRYDNDIKNSDLLQFLNNKMFSRMSPHKIQTIRTERHKNKMENKIKARMKKMKRN